jgi:phosphopantothenoylcysteine synthetase/decarboxylase
MLGLSPAEAEDAAQKVLVVAIRKIEHCRDESGLAPWLYRITRHVVANARRKLKSKGLDLIAANDISGPETAFDADTNRVVILDRAGGEERLPVMTKYEVAQHILDRVVALLAKSS